MTKLDQIISKVLDIPRVTPTNWNAWWDIWNANAKPLVRYQQNHNKPGKWIGFDCYRGDNYDPDTNGYYHSEFVDCSNVFPNLVDNIMPFFHKLLLIRILQSTDTFFPHNDFKDQEHIAVRTLLYDENPSSTFYYIINNEKVYQKLPSNSNSWIYKDHLVQHGSDFDDRYKKILITYYGYINFEEINRAYTSVLYNEYSAKI
jgi:hypothetical protein